MGATVQLVVRVDPKLKRELDRVVKRLESTQQAEVSRAIKERLERLATE